MTHCQRSIRLLLACLFVASALAAAEPGAGGAEALGEPSYPKERVAFRGALYFVATSNTRSAGLWRADETARTAVPFRELGIELNGEVTGLAASNDALLFGLRTAESLELWRTDGTIGGTQRVAALAPPGTLYEPANIPTMTASGGRCYFVVAEKGSSTLWASDGSAPGTVALRAEPAGFRDVVSLGRGVVFTTLKKGMLVVSVSEGTLASTQSLHGVECTTPGKPVVTAGRAWFVCQSRFGTRLQTTDGTERGLRVVPLTTATYGFEMSSIVPVAGGVSFLLGKYDAPNLWFSDGTPEGTTTLLEASDFDGFGSIGAFRNGVVFSARGPAASLWFSDGTRAGTRPLYPGALSSPGALASSFLAAGNRLFFALSTDDTGTEPWVTDGTAGGTRLVRDIFSVTPGAGTGSSLPNEFSEFNGLLVFVANDGLHGRELWRSDGTPDGTWLVANVHVEGSISGRVVDESDARPIAAATVEVYDSNRAGSVPLQTARTAEDGSYSATGLPSSYYYYVRATSPSGHVSEVWPDAVSVDGALAAATPVRVRAGEITPSIDFALHKGGTVRGNVRLTGGGSLSGVGIRVLDGNGRVVSSAASKADGSYESGSGLTTGSYFVQAIGSPSYTDQLFEALPCGVGCDPLKGTAVAVDGTSGRSKVDFTLGVRPTVRGRVVDSYSHKPIEGALIDARSTGKSWATAQADAEGNFVLRAPEGDVTLVASAQDHFRQVYPGVDCTPNCPAGGTVLQLKPGTELSGIDFALLREAMTFTGVATDAGTKLPLPGVRVEAIGDGWGTEAFATTDETGRYELHVLTYSSSIYLIVKPGGGYAGAIQGGSSCSGRCVVSRGTRFVPKGGSVVSGVDFSLERGGVALSGTVVARQSGAPVAGAEVEIYDRLGVPVQAWARPYSSKLVTGSDGRYDSGPILATGTHFVQITTAHGFVRELYSGMPSCDPYRTCSVRDGTPVNVTSSAASVANFQLLRQGVLSGRVYDHATGKGLPGAKVRLCLASFFSRCEEDTLTDVNGHYEAVAIPDGRYTVTASRSTHLARRYGGPICGDCDDEDGLSFDMAPGKRFDDVDFALERPGTMSGRVFDAATGKPIRAATLEIYSPEFSFVRVGAVQSDANGEYRADGLLEGTYFVAARSTDYATSSHAGRACTTWGCGDRELGNAVRVRFGMNTPDVNIPMFVNGTLRIAVVDKATGNPIARASVSIYGDSDSPLNTPTQTDAAGLVSYNVPPGAYRIMVNPEGSAVSFLYPGIVRWAKDFYSGSSVVVSPGKTADVRFEIAGVRIEAVIPPAAVIGAAATIDIRGSGFDAGAAKPKVTFGGVEGIVQSVTAWTLRVTPPAGLSGAVDLVVTNSNGVSATAPSKFHFLSTCVKPSISIRNPVIAIARGDRASLEVTITGGSPPFHVTWTQIINERSSYELSGTRETFEVRPLETTSYGLMVRNACGLGGWMGDPAIRVDVGNPLPLTAPLELTRGHGARP